MGKFKDIKIGDSVFIKDFVETGYHKGKSFSIKETVVKVTETQFVLNNGFRFRKDDGFRIGGRYEHCYNEGDKYGYNNEIITDQTKERDEFVKHVTVVRLNGQRLQKLADIRNYDISYQQAQIIANHIDEIESIFKTLTNENS